MGHLGPQNPARTAQQRVFLEHSKNIGRVCQRCEENNTNQHCGRLRQVTAKLARVACSYFLPLQVRPNEIRGEAVGSLGMTMRTLSRRGGLVGGWRCCGGGGDLEHYVLQWWRSLQLVGAVAWYCWRAETGREEGHGGRMQFNIPTPTTLELRSP